MGKFFDAYSAETTKLFRGKAFRVLCILLIVALLLVGATYAMISTLTGGVGNINTASQGLNPDIEAGLKEYQTLLDQYDAGIKNGTNKRVNLDRTRDNLKARVALYTYLKANNLSLHNVDIYSDSTGAMFNGKSAVSFMRTALMMLSQIVMFYVVVVAAGSIAGDKRDGIMKMSLMRPISRASMLSAKLTSALTVGVTALVVSAIISAGYAMLMYDVTSLPTLLVIDGVWVTRLSGLGVYAMEFAFVGIQILAMLMLTSFVATLTSNKSAALAVPLIILFLGGLMSILLSFLYIGYADFTTNLNFAYTLGIGSSIGGGTALRGQTFTGSLAITFAYIVVFKVGSYIAFVKKDIN